MVGFGVGIAQGYATLGQIGFAEHMDYTAIGTVTNVAARLCGEAKDGQILVGQRVAAAVEGVMLVKEIGDLTLKGLSRPISVFNVMGQSEIRLSTSPVVIRGDKARATLQRLLANWIGARSPERRSDAIAGRHPDDQGDHRHRYPTRDLGA